jgi:hypothetical protein
LPVDVNTILVPPASVEISMVTVADTALAVLVLEHDWLLLSAVKVLAVFVDSVPLVGVNFTKYAAPTPAAFGKNHDELPGVMRLLGVAAPVTEPSEFTDRVAVVDTPGAASDNTSHAVKLLTILRTAANRF